MLQAVNQRNERLLNKYRCARCDRVYYGPAGTRLIGLRYLRRLYAFQCVELGCPRCGGRLKEDDLTSGEGDGSLGLARA